MPVVPIVDDASDDLTGVFRRAWDQIVQEQVAIMNEPTMTLRRERLQELRGQVEALMDGVDADARDWINTRLTEVYGHGGIAGATTTVGFEWTQPHIDAIGELARDTYDDVLKATRFVRIDTKRFIREMGREQSLQQLIQSRTAQGAGTIIRDLIEQRGITSVVYANGARFGLDTYGEMLARTKSAMAYNMGTLNQAAKDGIEWWEIMDGPDCGLEFHDDSTRAAGMIVDKQTALSFPISHPNCRRTFAARPDIKTKGQARDAERFGTESQREAVRQADLTRQRSALSTQRRASAAATRRARFADMRARSAAAQAADGLETTLVT